VATAASTQRSVHVPLELLASMAALLATALSIGLVTLPCTPPAGVLPARWARATCRMHMPARRAVPASDAELPPPQPSPPGSSPSGFAALGRVRQYFHVQLVRPLLVHAFITYSTMTRHGFMKRTAQKKAEFEDNASRITWVGAWVNLVLAFFKLFAGVYGRSAAMIADAGHSFSDLFSDGLTLLSVRMSSLPADADHPYGHGRFESVGSLAIGTLLLGVGFSFGASALAALRAPAVAPLGSIALWAAIVSIGAKEALYQATARIGRQVRSQVLLANAWHHRSDALSSVVALAGIGGSLLGWRRLDPLAGLMVGGLVGWMGLRIALEALGQLTDTSDYAVVMATEQVASTVVGVVDVDQVRARSMGGSALVDLAIRVDPRLSASSAHKLAEDVRLAVLEEVPPKTDTDVSEVLVHVDTSAHDLSCPLQTSVLATARAHHEVTDDVSRKLRSVEQIVDVVRVEVFYLESGLAVEAHVRMSDELIVTQLREVASVGRQLLLDTSPDLTDAAVLLDLSEVEGQLAEGAGQVDSRPAVPSL